MEVEWAFVAFAIVTLAGGCGAEESGTPIAPPDEPARPGKRSVGPTADEGGWSLRAESRDRLPACTPETEGRLAFVVAEKTAFACASGEWAALELRGKDGRDGVDGRDGQSIVGPRGEKGDPGQSIVGAAGADGTPCSVEDTAAGARIRCGTATVDVADGANGAAGPAGPAGPTGATGPQGSPGTTTTINTSAYPNLRDASGNIIGQILQWDSAYTSYLVRAPSGVRLRVGSLGQFRNYTVGYQSIDCTGPAFIVRVPELWEDIVDTPAGVMVRHGVPTARNLQSRKNGPTASCTTQANTWDTYALRNLTTAEQADVWAYGTPYVD